MILAIDLGSTSFKAAVFDRRLRQVTAGRGRPRHRYGPGGRVELDAVEAERALRRAVLDALRRGPRIEAVAITSQAQTFTVLDARGRAARSFVSWQDRRGAAAATELARELPDFGRHCSFADLLAGLTVCQLRRRPAERGRRVVFLPTYFVRLWTGEAAVDENLAAMSGLYSLRQCGWWPAALRACGLAPGQLPRVVPVGAICARTTAAARGWGLPEGVPVVLAGNDQTAGGYAAELERGERVLVTLGTAQVAYACRRRAPAPAPGLARGPYPGGLWYRMAADNCGGSVIRWATTVLAGCGTYERFFAQAARSAPGSRGVAFGDDADTCGGAWTGLGLHHEPADMARAVLEELSRRMAGMLARLGVRAPTRVLAAGGGASQPLWLEVLGRECGMRLTPTAADPLLGAARMASAAGA